MTAKSFNRFGNREIETLVSGQVPEVPHPAAKDAADLSRPGEGQPRVP